MINGSQELVAAAHREELLFSKRSFFAQSFQRRTCRTVVAVVSYLISQLQIPRCEVDIEHASYSVFDVGARMTAAGSLLLLQPVTHSLRFAAQLIEIKF